MKTAILVPCLLRPEYTLKCIHRLEKAQEYKDCVFYLVDDGSCDSTAAILKNAEFEKKEVVIREESKGLRKTIIDFFEFVRKDPERFDYISKVDNDCLVPNNWLNDIIQKLETTDADILSPNVHPSNAAYQFGWEDPFNKGYRAAKFVGGLWTMKASLIKDIHFEDIEMQGIKGAIPLLKQIIIENSARVGWLTNVIFDDLGHWSGKHPEHIASKEHEEYSKLVGRPIAWSGNDI